MMGASPETSTVSVLAPGSSFTFAVLVVLSRTSTETVVVRKPADRTVTLVGAREQIVEAIFAGVVGFAACPDAGADVYDADVGIDHGRARRVHYRTNHVAGDGLTVRPIQRPARSGPTAPAQMRKVLNVGKSRHAISPQHEDPGIYAGTCIGIQNNITNR